MGILSGLTNKLKSKGSGLPLVEPPSYQAMLGALSQVKDPDLHEDIVTLGFVRNLRWQDGVVSFDLHLTSPACPVKEELKAQCQAALKGLAQVQEVRITLAADPVPGSARAPAEDIAALKPTAAAKPTAMPLAQVKQIIAVASGKGGVGKSTTAVNLAFSLAAAGAKVGLLDADVYGPSLTQMTGAKAPQAMAEQLLIPPEVEGVKIISVAMFTPPEKAQILRGPMAGNLIKQLLTQVAWGPLDYLIIDYPPGTGDIQLTISQVASVTAAIMVTSPQEVALLDVRKAMAMFTTMKVPILGIIETMSYFVCDGCDKKHYIFRQGGGQRLSTSFGLPLLAEIPMAADVTASGDQGRPLVVSSREHLAAVAYQEAAGRMVRELAILNSKASGALSSFTLNWRGNGE